LKKRARKISLLVIWTALLGCSSHHFSTGITSLTVPSSAYSNTLFSPQPSFIFAGNSSSAPAINDSVTLGAYLDSACTAPAVGTLSATQNPVPVVGTNSGTFAGVEFTCTNHLEETIYLRGTSANTSVCTSAIAVAQHFNVGLGYAITGATGAAGATGASEQDAIVKFQTDPSGRYIGVGHSKNSSGGVELAIWRFYPDGTLDTTFGTNGVTVFGATGAAGGTGAGELDMPTDFQLDSSGRLVIVGYSENSSGGIEVVVWRYLASGALDTSFGSAPGYAVSGPDGAAGEIGSAEVDKGMALNINESTGYVVAGSSKNTGGGTEATLWRFTLTTGVLDTTFNTTGFINFGVIGASGATNAQEVDIPTAVQVDTSGNFIVGGQSANASGGVELAIWRFSLAGAVDTTFGLSTGAVVFGPVGTAGGTGASESDLVNALQINSNNAYVLSGSSANATGGKELVIWRYTNTGTLDTTFNTTGYVVSGTTGAAGATGANENDVPMSFQFDASGNYVMVGTSANSASNGKELVLWRYTSAGVLDTTFNTTGYILFGATGAAGATAANENDVGLSLQIDAKGRFVISGSSVNTGGGQEAVMWRYLAAGTLEI
jgi:uncharacterized delta-60 repeat protein